METAKRRWSRFIGAIATTIVITLAALGSNPAAAACTPPGDHWRWYSSSSKAYFDHYGFTACFSAGINPNWCRRTYRVTKYTIDPGPGPGGSGVWVNAGYYYTTIKCYWYD